MERAEFLLKMVEFGNMKRSVELVADYVDSKFAELQGNKTQEVVDIIVVKDKRIAELEGKLTKSQMLCIERGDNLLAARNELMLSKEKDETLAGLKDLLAERNARVVELKQEIARLTEQNNRQAEKLARINGVLESN